MPVPIVPPPAPVVSCTPVPAGGVGAGCCPSCAGVSGGATPSGGSGGVANFLSISACIAAVSYTHLTLPTILRV